MGEKNKIPSIVTQIKTQPVKEVNYGFQKSISYSQLSMYSSCPHKWALQYRDGHKYSESSIHMTFGTSLHETLQHYITTIYEITGAEADRINLEEYFQDCFSKNYLKDYKSNKNIHFSDPVQMNEFYEDGIEILKFIKKKRNALFGKNGWFLVGCEVPIVLTPLKPFSSVLYKGYLDVVLYNEPTKTFKIIDVKTSGRGWGDKEKKDELKQFQLILYKYFFSIQFGIPIDNIKIEFLIVKRKVWEKSEYPISRIQEFRPASGKVKVNKAVKLLNKFIEDVFNIDGTYKDIKYEPNPSKWGCTYCSFNQTPLCDKGII